MAFLGHGIAALEQRTHNPCTAIETLPDIWYPAATLRYTPNLTCCSLKRPERRCLGSWPWKPGNRNYTSTTASPSDSQYQESLEPSRASKHDLSALKTRLDLSDEFNSDMAWARFWKLNNDEKKLFYKPLLLYLHNSNQQIDLQRRGKLFSMLNLQEKDDQICRYAIQGHLLQYNYAIAIKVYNSAVKELKMPVGFDIIIRCLIQRKRWPKAYKFWKNEPILQSDLNFFKFIGNSPPSLSIAYSLVTWVNNNAQSQGGVPPSDLIRFASVIVLKALMTTNPSPGLPYFRILKNISNWVPLTGDFYSKLFTSLDKSKQKLRLLKCYAISRSNRNFSLSPTSLNAVLQECCNRNNVLGMKRVFDDFFFFHSKPSRAAYRMCLKGFSRQGDAKTVHALFEQYISRYKNNSYDTLIEARHKVKTQSKQDKSDKSYCHEEIDEAAPLTPNDFAPLLNVHAKRGEVADLEKVFDQIQDIYLLRPNILLWNIRLSAYVKIQDIEMAYWCFEEILEDPELEPDHYTLGTMMTICSSKADLDRARDVFQLAKKLNIPHSAAMLNCFVVCLIRNDKFAEAEEICTSSAALDLVGSKTPIWNSLVIGYALNRDLDNVNRIFRVMLEKNIDPDQLTYAALMQALVMTRQPNLASRILFKIMPEAGMPPTSFNYAVLLGGYLAIQNWEGFEYVHKRLLHTRMRRNASTKFLTLRAATLEDSGLNDKTTTREKLQRSFQIFSETMAMIDPQDLSEAAKKGAGQMPIDIMYPAMFYSFTAYILGLYKENKISSELFEQYKALIPKHRKKASEPMKIITAMMSNELAYHDHDGVERCWEKAILLAKEESASLPPLANTTPSGDISEPQIPYFHQFKLNGALRIFIKSLIAQKRIGKLNKVIENLTSYGFQLDNFNWNEYIKCLARSSKDYKLAFQICEVMLMPGWPGWRIQRRKLAGHRHNIPLAVRRAKHNPRSLRPYYDTMMWLTRRMIDLQAQAAENPEIQKLVNILRHEHPLTISAIDQIPRTNTDAEDILKSDNSRLNL